MQNRLTTEQLKAIEKIIADQLDVEPDQIQGPAALMDDLGADSLDLVEIAMHMEETFNLTVPDEQFEQVRTVEDLWEVAGRLLHGGCPDGPA